MKKTIVLMTIVLAILAAPVFAEVTASGDVDFRFGMNGDVYAEKNDNDVTLNLGATIGDFTSVTVEMSATNETGESDAVTLDQMVLTQDVTGALGVDAPVGVAMSFGVTDFMPKQYQAVAGYGDFEYDDDMADPYTYNVIGEAGTIMTKASISIVDMVTVDVAMYEPGVEFMSDAMQFGINAYGTFGMVDASVSYLKFADEMFSIGVNAAAAPVDGLEVGAGFTQANDGTETYSAFGVSAAYTIDALTAGVAMKSIMSSVDSPLEFGDVTNYAVNVNYMVTEELKAFAAAKITGDMSPVDTDLADTLGYEVGASYVLDGVTYSLGYTDASDYVAYDAGGEDGNVFFRVQASF
jgi:hypothetical protein